AQCHDRYGTTRSVRPILPRIRRNQGAIQVFSECDMHRVVRCHGGAEFPNTFQERRSSVANQATRCGA
ncbi:unnamed protein product, partial [marine sediment metagenome]